MGKETIYKSDLLEILNDNRDCWKTLKEKQQNQLQDVTTENFIDNVIYVYNWVIDTVENFPFIL